MTMRLLILLMLFSITCQPADRIPLTEKELTLPPYRQFTLRDGLPQMQVIRMLQDSRGYIWIGTKAGLSCFNGDKFVSFTRNDGLSNDYIYSLAEDFEGNIWMGTSTGMACFDGVKIRDFPHNLLSGHHLAPAPDGKIWFTGTDIYGTIFFGYFEKGKYTLISDRFHFRKPLNSPQILYSVKEKAVIIRIDAEIFEYRNDIAQRIYRGRDSLILFKSPAGSILAADFYNLSRFNILEYDSGKFREIARIRDGAYEYLPLFKDTLHFSYESTQFPIFTLTPDTVLIEKPLDIQKNCILSDKDGKIWLGTEEGVFQPLPEAFSTYKKEYLPQVWSITEDEKANIWFASFYFGIKQWDGRVLQLFRETTREYDDDFYHFRPSRSKEGTLFFPGGKGLTSYDGKIFRKINKGTSYLTTFYDSENDLLWAGGYKRTDVFDRQNRLVRTIGADDSLGMQRFYITINKDDQGNIWMGGTNCLSKYRWETQDLTHYTVKNGKLPFEKALIIYNDPYQRMWLGTSDGLFRYFKESDQFSKINHDFLNGPVNLITSVDTSWLIVSQPIGIYLMDMQKFNHSGEIRLFLYNAENGFVGIEPGQDGAFTDSRGYIWMTSGTEVVRLDPKKLRFYDYILNVRISRCNGQPLSYQTTTFSLPDNSQNAIVEFDAICFNRPFPVQYSWKQNNEMEWSSWQESNYAVLTGLSNGKCKVEVRARVPGLPLPEYASASLVLQVNLAFWKQAWFFPALFGLLTLLALITLVLLLKTRIRMSEANRQAKVSQIQAIQSQMNPHFIFNALASLQSMILSVNMEKANEYLVKLSALIRGFLEASVFNGTSEAGKNEKTEISLADELTTLGNYISFQQLIYPGRFEYVPEIDPEIDPVRQTIPPMLLQPFVENAIRHGLLPKKGKGKLGIHISPAPRNGLKVEIADDGIGMEKAGKAIRKSPFRFVSRGRELTLKRIRLMNETGYNIQFNTSSSGQGTKIILQINHHGK